MAEYDLYDDLDDFHKQEERKSAELIELENKYKGSLAIIEDLKKENKGLTKKVKLMELNFKSLLETAKSEIKRKDDQIHDLRKEKDDICFRRKIGPAFRNGNRSEITSRSVAFSSESRLQKPENLNSITGVTLVDKVEGQHTSSSRKSKRLTEEKEQKKPYAHVPKVDNTKNDQLSTRNDRSFEEAKERRDYESNRSKSHQSTNDDLRYNYKQRSHGSTYKEEKNLPYDNYSGTKRNSSKDTDYHEHFETHYDSTSSKSRQDKRLRHKELQCNTKSSTNNFPKEFFDNQINTKQKSKHPIEKEEAKDLKNFPQEWETKKKTTKSLQYLESEKDAITNANKSDNFKISPNIKESSQEATGAEDVNDNANVKTAESDVLTDNKRNNCKVVILNASIENVERISDIKSHKADVTESHDDSNKSLIVNKDENSNIENNLTTTKKEFLFDKLFGASPHSNHAQPLKDGVIEILSETISTSHESVKNVQLVSSTAIATGNAKKTNVEEYFCLNRMEDAKNSEEKVNVFNNNNGLNTLANCCENDENKFKSPIKMEFMQELTKFSKMPNHFLKDCKQSDDMSSSSGISLKRLSDNFSSIFSKNNMDIPLLGEDGQDVVSTDQVLGKPEHESDKTVNSPPAVEVQPFLLNIPNIPSQKNLQIAPGLTQSQPNDENILSHNSESDKCCSMRNNNSKESTNETDKHVIKVDKSNTAITDKITSVDNNFRENIQHTLTIEEEKPNNLSNNFESFAQNVDTSITPKSIDVSGNKLTQDEPDHKMETIEILKDMPQDLKHFKTIYVNSNFENTNINEIQDGKENLFNKTISMSNQNVENVPVELKETFVPQEVISTYKTANQEKKTKRCKNVKRKESKSKDSGVTSSSDVLNLTAALSLADLKETYLNKSNTRKRKLSSPTLSEVRISTHSVDNNIVPIEDGNGGKAPSPKHRSERMKKSVKYDIRKEAKVPIKLDQEIIGNIFTVNLLPSNDNTAFNKTSLSDYTNLKRTQDCGVKSNNSNDTDITNRKVKSKKTIRGSRSDDLEKIVQCSVDLSVKSMKTKENIHSVYSLVATELPECATDKRKKGKNHNFGENIQSSYTQFENEKKSKKSKKMENTAQQNIFDAESQANAVQNLPSTLFNTLEGPNFEFQEIDLQMQSIFESPPCKTKKNNSRVFDLDFESATPLSLRVPRSEYLDQTQTQTKESEASNTTLDISDISSHLHDALNSYTQNQSKGTNELAVNSYPSPQPQSTNISPVHPLGSSGFLNASSLQSYPSVSKLRDSVLPNQRPPQEPSVAVGDVFSPRTDDMLLALNDCLLPSSSTALPDLSHVSCKSDAIIGETADSSDVRRSFLNNTISNTETKKISMGLSEYVIEKISPSASHISITRKKIKKKSRLSAAPI